MSAVRPSLNLHLIGWLSRSYPSARDAFFRDGLRNAGIMREHLRWFGICAPCPSKKYTKNGRFWHKNRGIPQGKPLLGRLRRVDKSLSRRNTRSQKHPTRELSLSRALPVGYLGFCARIPCLRCAYLRETPNRPPNSGGRPANGTAELLSDLPGCQSRARCTSPRRWWRRGS